MKRLRLLFSATSALALLVTSMLALLGTGVASAQSNGGFAVTSIMRSCDADVLIVDVENTTGLSWSLSVGFYNSSSNASQWVDAGDQGLNTSAMVPYNGEPFDQVSLDIRLSDGWRFAYSSFVGLCGEQVVPNLDNSWPPLPQVNIEISNASCTSFDWLVVSDQPVRLEIGVIKPAAAGDFPIQVIDFNGGETSGTFVPGVDWPAMLLYVRAYAETAPGEFEFQADQTQLIEDCAAVIPPIPTQPPTPVSPGEGTTVTIVVTMPDGSSIEGAPWALYAPVASMQRAGAFASGFVGPNNTIVIDNLPDGDYTLVISPEGRDPITLEIAVSGESGGTQLIPVNLALPTETPTVTPPSGTNTPVATSSSGGQAPVGTSASSASTSGSSVSGLPKTGSGGDATANWLVAAALMAVMTSATGAVVSYRFGKR